MARQGVLRRLWNLLRSNDTAVILLLCLSLLFGIATLIREALPDAYERLFGDDLRFFLKEFRAIDLWFWGIALFCLLLGLSLATCAIDRFAGRLRNGSRDPREYGTILLHIGVGIALLAHLVDGLEGSASMVRLDESFRSVGEREVRVIKGELETNRNGSIRSQRVWIETRDSEGRATLHSSAPNDPAIWNGGSELLLLMRLDRQPTGAVFRTGVEIDTLGIGMQRLLPDGGVLLLEQIFGPPEFRIPVARVRVSGGAHPGSHLVGKGISPPIPGLALHDLAFSPAALLNHRKAPGTPWLVTAAVVLSIGCMLIAAGWLRRETDTLDSTVRKRGGVEDGSDEGAR